VARIKSRAQREGVKHESSKHPGKGHGVRNSWSMTQMQYYKIDDSISRTSKRKVSRGKRK
jgi:hypothetical protein